MNNPSQEDLLGYVLGALDAQEHRDVQQSIDDNPEIEEQLLQIKNSLVPLDCLESSGSRPGLARRTCESVASWQNQANVDSLEYPHVSIDDCLKTIRDEDLDDSEVVALEAASSTTRGSAKLRPTVSERLLHPNSWSIPDVLAGMAIVAILAGILFPTISYTRQHSRIAACQNNLTQVGVALMSFSSVNDGRFVSVPSMGKMTNVGCIGPILKDSGFLEDESVFACAGVAAELPPVQIPSCKQVNNSLCAKEMDHYRRTMSGHFGYTMGYEVNGQYHAPRYLGRSNVVLVADRPSCLPGRISENHGGKGQNCLFEDGRVCFVKGHSYGGDAIFENDYGIVGPGSHESDNVIAPSHLSLSLGQLNSNDQPVEIQFESN